MKCLMIDDDLEDQEIFQLAMQEVFPKARCYFAVSCPEAIEKLSKNIIPIPLYIFMDWNMPLMEASHCIYDLRKVAGMREVPLFILSGTLPPINGLTALGIRKSLIKQPSVSLLSKELYLALNNQS